MNSVLILSVEYNLHHIGRLSTVHTEYVLTLHTAHYTVYKNSISSVSGSVCFIHNKSLRNGRQMDSETQGTSQKLSCLLPFSVDFRIEDV